MTSMVRAFTLTFLSLLLLAPSGAFADPLLSGYGGPGGGEQVVLGSSLVGRSGGSSGSGTGDSIRATPAPAAAASGTAPAPAATGRHKPTKRSGTGHPKRPAASPPAAGAAPATVATGAPPVRAYPSRASEVGGLPLSAGDLLICLLALVALFFGGAALRRLSGTVQDDPATAQATAR